MIRPRWTHLRDSSKTDMMNTEMELRNHMLVEFLCRGRSQLTSLSLNEDGHHVTEIDELDRYFGKLVSDTIYDAIKVSGKCENVYARKIPIKTFFNSYYLYLKVFRCKNESDNAYSGVCSNASVFKDENGEWVCRPKIKLTVRVNNMMNAYRQFSLAICHELTHCWNLYRYALETGKSPYEAYVSTRYDKIKDSKSDMRNQAASSASILYLLNRMERNAYIAQLRNELDKIDTQDMTFQEFYNEVKKTQSYMKFKYLEENVALLFQITDNGLQSEFIDALNGIMGKNYTTYNQLLKYYSRRWQKWKNAYLKNAARIAYDVYYKEGNNTWLGDENNNETRVNPNR